MYYRVNRDLSRLYEEKLKKEMNAVMTEFNATAEMNITLLENRIRAMKKLLEKSGALPSIDITVGDEMRHKENSATETHDAALPPYTFVAKTTNQEHAVLDARPLAALKEVIMGLVYKFVSRPSVSAEAGAEPVSGALSGDLLSRTVEQVMPELAKNSDSVDMSGNGENLREYLLNSIDLHSDLYRLHQQGFDVALLARSAGMSEGEVNLVLNLRSKG